MSIESRHRWFLLADWWCPSVSSWHQLQHHEGEVLFSMLFYRNLSLLWWRPLVFFWISLSITSLPIIYFLGAESMEWHIINYGKFYHYISCIFYLSCYLSRLLLVFYCFLEHSFLLLGFRFGDFTMNTIFLSTALYTLSYPVVNTTGLFFWNSILYTYPIVNMAVCKRHSKQYISLFMVDSSCL